jgi:hypothetical protein
MNASFQLRSKCEAQSSLNRSVLADWEQGKAQEEIEMNKSLSAFIFAAATLITGATPFTSANADTVVRDHRTICVVDDQNCRDHRGSVVVVPPIVRPEPPVTVIVDPVRPHPPVVVIDPIHVNQGHDQDDGDNFGISCGQGRNILRHEGFRYVRAYDCEGRYYRYFATKNRRAVSVKMTNNGDIVSIRNAGY